MKLKMKRIKSYNNGATCYFIATPIGNLDDFSPRAKQILSSVNFIACEDTRTTSALLNHFNIKKNLISYHEHNEQLCSTKLISILKEGKSIAICSDAGYPGISDPGQIIAQHCIENDIPISVIPGANAFIPALIGSGLDSNHFYFHGFLSSKPSKRLQEIKDLMYVPCTLIFYESPHRIKQTLLDLYHILGNRKISIAREITKLHEEYIRGTLEELSQIDESTLKGEMVLIVEKGHAEKIDYDDDTLIIKIKSYTKNGTSLKDACKLVAEETGIKKNYLYNLTINNQE